MIFVHGNRARPLLLSILTTKLMHEWKYFINFISFVIQAVLIDQLWTGSLMKYLPLAGIHPSLDPHEIRQRIVEWPLL